MLSLSNFVMGRKGFHNLHRKIFISGLECNMKLKFLPISSELGQNSSDRINTIFTYCHTCMQLVIFREKVLDLRPKSVCVVEMTNTCSLDMYKCNKKDAQA